MDFDKYNIGFGITGSFCTFAKARKAVEHLCEMGANVIPIFSFNAQTCDTRFGSAKEYVEGICEITGNEGIRSICAAEPIGPNNFLDIMVIAPCTGNTAAKLTGGIVDTPVRWRQRRICATVNRLSLRFPQTMPLEPVLKISVC